MNTFIKNWLRPEIKKLSAYQTEDPPKCIKLDAMENPYVISDALNKRYLLKLKNANLNRYPNINTPKLKQVLKRHLNLSEDNDILLGNGSDELIQILALAALPNATMMSFTPSFVMYEIIAKLTCLNYVSCPLDAHFNIDLDGALNHIKKHRPQLIFIAYPNNPTGNLFNKNHIHRIIKASSGLVVLDEAYAAYAHDNFLGILKNYDNLLIMRTISKIGLAGLRLGFLIGSKDKISELNKLRLPYNINTLTQISAQFFLSNYGELSAQIARIIKNRTELVSLLTKLSIIRVFKSEANFVLFKAGGADNLFHYLRKNDVLIKNLSAQQGLKNCLRVTVGTRAENHVFMDLVYKYYNKSQAL